MKKIHIITVGKLRDKNLIEIEKNYLGRISTFSVEIHELRSHDEKLEIEAKEVLTQVSQLKLSPSQVILLKENGQSYDSPSFSQWVMKKLEHQDQFALVFGGAAGHGQSVLNFTSKGLSLSKMTFPHQIARVLLAEQLYRSETIFKGHPYHK